MEVATSSSNVYHYSYSKFYIFHCIFQIAEYSIDEDLDRHMLIINNKTFTGGEGLAPRRGSEVDVRKLRLTFSRRRYIVEVLQDLSARVRITNLLRLYFGNSKLLFPG